MIEEIIGYEWIPEEEVIAGADISHYVEKIVQLERRLGDGGRKQNRNQLLEERNEALVGLASLVWSQRYTDSEVQERAHAERAKLRAQAAFTEMAEKFEKKDGCSMALRNFLRQDFSRTSLSNPDPTYSHRVSDCVTN